jgi:hypothetical protein
VQATLWPLAVVAAYDSETGLAPFIEVRASPPATATWVPAVFPVPEASRGRTGLRLLCAVDCQREIKPLSRGIAVMKRRTGDALLIAENLSDDAVLLDARTGKLIYVEIKSSGDDTQGIRLQ